MLRHSTSRLAACLCLIVGPHIAYAAADIDSMNKLATMGAWSLHVDANKPHRLCFLTSEPKSSDPADTARDAPRAYISAWPQDGVKSELSFRLGFPSKKGGQITALIADSSYRLFADDDRVYVGDATQELKLIEAMKKGAQVAVTASTPTAVSVTDTYSLTGLGQALQQLKETCF
ncbi:MAG: hypothetical protein ACRCS9_04995 [Hyphomicrobium sp.]